MDAVLLIFTLVFAVIGVGASVNFALTEGQKLFRKASKAGQVLGALALALTVLASNGVSYAQATAVPLDFDIDVTPLFNQISTYLPLFLGVLAVGGAIGIAVKLSKFIIASISAGFGGGGKG